jgi:hypothetical protein
VALVGNGQLLAALGAAAGQHAASILRGHALTEAMLVHTAAIVGLECSFHCAISLFVVVISFEEVGHTHVSGCKITQIFSITQEIIEF